MMLAFVLFQAASLTSYPFYISAPSPQFIFLNLGIGHILPIVKNFLWLLSVIDVYNGILYIQNWSL